MVARPGHTACLAWALAVAGMLNVTACDRPTPLGTGQTTFRAPATRTVATPTIMTTDGPRTPTTTVSPALAPSPTPTGTPEPIGPITVTMTLQEAEFKAADRFVASNEARLEGAFYLTTDALCETLQKSGEELWLWDRGWTVDACMTDPAYGPDRYTSVRAPAFVLVDVSFRGMDIEYPGVEQPTEPGSCLLVPSAVRARILVWFDATTGEYLGWHGSTGASNEAWYSSGTTYLPIDLTAAEVALESREPGQPLPYDAAATALADRREATKSAWSRISAATPTPSPTLSHPVGSARPRALGAGEVPHALSEIAAVAPLVPGARWKYRVTGVLNGADWWTGTYTESVASCSRLASDLVAVRFLSSLSGGIGTHAHPWASGGEFALRYLVPDGVIHPLGDVQPGLSIEAWLALEPEWGTGSPLYSVRLPLRAGEQYNYWWQSVATDDISVPAGEFVDCTVNTEIFNAGNSTAHWLCPGVGYVRHELPGCSSMHGGYIVYELEDYFIPPIKLVP